MPGDVHLGSHPAVPGSHGRGPALVAWLSDSEAQSGPTFRLTDAHWGHRPAALLQVLPFSSESV